MAEKDCVSRLSKVPYLTEACFLLENSCIRRACDGSCFQVSLLEICAVQSFSSLVSFMCPEVFSSVSPAFLLLEVELTSSPAAVKLTPHPTLVNPKKEPKTKVPIGTHCFGLVVFIVPFVGDRLSWFLPQLVWKPAQLPLSLSSPGSLLSSTKY